jgi:hypothetical protein
LRQIAFALIVTNIDLGEVAGAAVNSKGHDGRRPFVGTL